MAGHAGRRGTGNHGVHAGPRGRWARVCIQHKGESRGSSRGDEAGRGGGSGTARRPQPGAARRRASSRAPGQPGAGSFRSSSRAAAVGPAGSLQAGKRRRSFPPSGLEREEEAGEVPPPRARGRAAGEREGGGEKPAGNHLRLPRPPRPAPRPVATRRPSALCWGDRAVPELPGRRPRPQPSPRAPGPSPRPHPKPEWGTTGRRGGGGAGTARPARIRLLTCAAAVTAESLSCFPGNAGGPVWVLLVSPLQGCGDFWDALVNLEKDLNKSPSGQEFCSQLGI